MAITKSIITLAKNNFFQNFLPKSLAVSKRNRNFVVWYIATSVIVKRSNTADD